jgi:hypothetical protein
VAAKGLRHAAVRAGIAACCDLRPRQVCPGWSDMRGSCSSLTSRKGTIRRKSARCVAGCSPRTARRCSHAARSPRQILGP